MQALRIFSPALESLASFSGNNRAVVAFCVLLLFAPALLGFCPPLCPPIRHLDPRKKTAISYAFYVFSAGIPACFAPNWCFSWQLGNWCFYMTLAQSIHENSSSGAHLDIHWAPDEAIFDPLFDYSTQKMKTLLRSYSLRWFHIEILNQSIKSPRQELHGMHNELFVECVYAWCTFVCPKTFKNTLGKAFGMPSIACFLRLARQSPIKTPRQELVRASIELLTWRLQASLAPGEWRPEKTYWTIYA